MHDTEPKATVSLDLRVRARPLTWTLISVSFLLSLASYGMHLATRAADTGSVAALDVGDEVSLPTWFATLLLVLAAVVLVLGGRHAAAIGMPTRGWNFLAVVMVLLSIDEAVSIHERVGSALRDILDTGGVLYYVWVVPAVAFAVVVALVQISWLRRLAPRTRNLVILAGVVFVAGAAGLELVAGSGDEVLGTERLASVTLSAIEELAEMLGVSIFVGAILGHLESHDFRVALRSSD